jgi:prepilin signal peptidase PulO-like enzyme (type II secretory pathway)
LAAGSFLNAIIHRLEKGESAFQGRSYCPHCRHQLSWQDLIPLLSFFILKSRCRYCQHHISLQYPVVEFITGAIFVLIVLSQLTVNKEQLTVLNVISFSYLLIVTCFLIIIFVYDLKHYIIPDKVIYPAIAAAIIFNFQFLISKQFSIFNYSILSAILAAAFFLIIVLVSRGKWMGVGDIKLAFFMGFFLGFPNILAALFLAFFFGAIIGVGLIIARKKTIKSEVPFGPFLVAGTFIALFWGQTLVNWYLNLFLQ